MGAPTAKNINGDDGDTTSTASVLKVVLPITVAARERSLAPPALLNPANARYVYGVL